MGPRVDLDGYEEEKIFCTLTVEFFASLFTDCTLAASYCVSCEDTNILNCGSTVNITIRNSSEQLAGCSDCYLRQEDLSYRVHRDSM